MRTFFHCYLVAWLGYAASVQAHTTRISYSDIRVTGQSLSYTLEVSPHDLAVLAGLTGPQDALLPWVTFDAARSRLADAMCTGIMVQNDDALVCRARIFCLSASDTDWRGGLAKRPATALLK